MPKDAEAPPNSPYGRLRRIYDQTFAPEVEPNLDALRAITELRVNLTECEDNAALSARRHGATWQQIADALGITRQRAHQRWGAIDAVFELGPEADREHPRPQQATTVVRGVVPGGR